MICFHHPAPVRVFRSGFILSRWLRERTAPSEEIAREDVPRGASGMPEWHQGGRTALGCHEVSVRPGFGKKWRETNLTQPKQRPIDILQHKFHVAVRDEWGGLMMVHPIPVTCFHANAQIV